MIPNKFQSMIRRILNEEIEKSSTNEKIIQRVPEVVTGEDNEKLLPNEKSDKSKEKMLEEMTKLVSGINESYTVCWDDHDDMTVQAADLFKIRISPRWENNFNIEAFIRKNDRIYITGQNWEQVKSFVKNNLKDSTTAVEKAQDKVVKNREDATKSPDKGLPQKDKPDEKTLSNTKNKNKDYIEKTEADQNLPMEAVKDTKKQIDHKQKEPVKLKKKTPDTKLVVKS